MNVSSRTMFDLKKLTRETFRLGSTIARLKLKGIDGNSHKRWSMWFNSIQRAKPYQPLHYEDIKYSEMNILNKMESSFSEGYFSFIFIHTGVAWLSSARVVKCLVNSINERNPYL